MLAGLLSALTFGPAAVGATETERVALSGEGPANATEWEFRCSEGRGCGSWSALPVPSQWELHGFGAYNYGHDDRQSRERGSYRRRFEVPRAWEGRTVFLVFEGVMTEARVRVNGQPVGEPHQGAFYRFRIEVGDLLRFPGPNLLEVEVAKRSADRSVNRAEREADYWIFGGIFRPVYLEALPVEHLASLAIDADAGGDLEIAVEAAGLESRADLIAEVVDPEGRSLGVLKGSIEPSREGGHGTTRLAGRIAGAEPWSAETPTLHRLRLTLSRNRTVLHRRRTSFGFRTVEVRPGRGLFVNGSPVRLKGVNRHSFWPDSGRATDPAVSEGDVELIRSMNLNAVRTAHYPPDVHFLEACDRLGLYVIDELAGWHDAYDTTVGSKLVEAMVTRDRNHPSVILWSNGNEDGWNRDLDPLFARFDPQRRSVIHPRSRFGGFDTFHYPTHDELSALLRQEEKRGERGLLVMPTELLHGLYDGGHGAGLADFWELLRNSPAAVGGFLWSLFDEAVRRTDDGGRLDTDGNHAADGIVGPYRQPEGSVATVRRVFSPVGFELLGRSGSRVELEISNDFDFRDLSGLSFDWQLLRFPGPLEGAGGRRVVADGRLAVPPIVPRSTGRIEVELPPEWIEADAWQVKVSAADGREVVDWQLLLTDRRSFSRRVVKRRQGSVAAREDGTGIALRAGETEVVIDRATGQLQRISLAGRSFPLSAGPRPVHGESRPISVAHRAEPGAHVVTARFAGELDFVIWRLYGSGWLQILYQYSAIGDADYLGVGFDLAERGIRGMSWLGEGPYRVWGNRRGGQPTDLWRKGYNDTVTGQSWDYPEFKGYHAAPYWARVETDQGDLVLVLADPGIDLQLLTPSPWSDPRHATAPFPDADLSLLHAIPPIGTKFHPATDLGPSGAGPRGEGAYRGELYLWIESPVTQPDASQPETRERVEKENPR